MSTYSIAPSLPASSFNQLENLARALNGVTQELQIDLVDGIFAKPASWPFTEPEPVAEFKKIESLPANFLIEVDCMVMHPEQYLSWFEEEAITRVLIHIGSTERYKEIFAHAKTYGYKVGIAFTNDVPLAKVAVLIPEVDYVQVMGIETVGKQGQPFDERTLQTIISLRTQYPTMEIAVDGAVNENTIRRLQEAGANRFAPGSAISGAENPADALQQLVQLLV